MVGGVIRRSHCIRCGECCLKSSPTLLKGDLSLIDKQVIKLHEIYTIRQGERVNDNIGGGESTITKRELIKIREKNGVTGGCIFYSEPDRSCTIYAQRPAQCSTLKCWDTDDFMDVYKRPKLERKDIIKDGVLIGLIDEHEKRCGYSTILGYMKRIEEQGETALEKIIEILKFDYAIRPFVSQKLDVDPALMDLYFGRTLKDTIKMFGLQVIREKDGSFLLTIGSR